MPDIAVIASNAEIADLAREIAAADSDLWAMADEGRFRHDLYHRLTEGARGALGCYIGQVHLKDIVASDGTLKDSRPGTGRVDIRGLAYLAGRPIDAPLPPRV